MPDQDVILTDQQVLAVSSGAWPLPQEGNGICSRWLDSFIATRLQDVFARRFYELPFHQLSVEDRTAIRQRVEEFVESMVRQFDETHVEAVRR